MFFKRIMKKITWALFSISLYIQHPSLIAADYERGQVDEAGLIARGRDVDELDPKHTFLSEKLHKMFNPLDMGANWQVAADHLWMPPLDISGEGLALYKNAKRYILEVDAQHVSEERPLGGWLMLFNEDGELLNDVYFAGIESIEAHIIYIGDMDQDGHLEWLVWGANVIGPGRDRTAVKWEVVDDQFSSDSLGSTVQLFVMNDNGVLEYKWGKDWAQQYRYAAETICPTTAKQYTYAPDKAGNPSLAQKNAEKLIPYLCISAMEGTNDSIYIKDIIQRLQVFPRKYWKIKDFAEISSTAGKPALQQALEQLGE